MTEAEHESCGGRGDRVDRAAVARNPHLGSLPEYRARGKEGAEWVWGGVAWVVIVVGVVLRVARWWGGRSLWLDEILLARNLLGRSTGGLLRPLDFRQGAPPLFLLLEKGAMGVFGVGERGMRVVPLVAGVVALPVMYWVARRVLGGRGAVVAVGILAVVEPAVYYSSEVKQYSTDLLTTLVVWWAFLWYREHPTRGRAAVLFCLGAVGMYLSHPAVFVLAGGVGAMWVWRGKGRDGSQASRLNGGGGEGPRDCNPWAWLGFAVGWGIVFVPDYWFFLRPLSQEGGLRAYWADAFMPWSVSAVVWGVNALWGVFADYATLWITGPGWPAAYAVAGLGAAVLGVGAVARRSGGMAWFVGGPVVVAMGAAAVHAYPFSGRLLLFLVPVPIVLMAAVFLPARGGDWVDRVVFAVARGAVVLGVLVPSAVRAGRFLVRPPGREEMRPVVAELAREVKKGDVVYIYHGASAGFGYYGKGYDWRGVEVIEGRNRDEDVRAFEEDVPGLVEKGRAWVVFSHTPTGTSSDARFVGLLPEGTRVVRKIEARGAGAYLYEFGGRNQD